MSNRALLPQWAKLPPKLRNHFADVWSRLPNSARVTLNELRPAITQTNTGNAAAYAGIELLPNGKYRYVINIMPDRFGDMPPWVIRYLLAHELAHLVLRHPDMMVMEDFLNLSEVEAATVANWREASATMLVWLWGFRAELEQSVNPAMGEIMYRAEKPPWYDGFMLGQMGGDRN